MYAVMLFPLAICCKGFPLTGGANPSSTSDPGWDARLCTGMAEDEVDHWSEEDIR